MPAKILYLVLMVFSVMYFGCVGNDSQTSSKVLADNYKYSFFDTSGNSFIEGKMKLLASGERLTGEYTVDTSFGDRPSGFSSLPGILSGNINTKEMAVFLNLNPKIADNNIFVYASLVQDSLNGYWVQSTMVGIKAKGDFRAVKIKQP